MQYKDLNELMKASSTAKAFFDTLTPRVQIALQKQSGSINTTEDLYAFAKSVNNYMRAENLMKNPFAGAE